MFWTLTYDNLKNSLRTRKAMIFLVLYLLVFGLLTYAFFRIQANIDDQIKSHGMSSFQVSFLSGFLHSIVSTSANNSSVVDFIFTIPPININLYFVSLIGTPLLIFILNYDKVSQEIYDGTIRFMVFRASRLKIFLSKFFSGMIECAAITLLATVLGITWASLSFESVNFMQSLGLGIRYWFLAQFFLAAFVAFSLMASAIFKKPFTSLIFSFVSYVAMPVIRFFVPFVSPYDPFYFDKLFFPNSLDLLFGVLIYLLYTMIFLNIGFYLFKKTDL